MYIVIFVYYRICMNIYIYIYIYIYVYIYIFTHVDVQIYIDNFQHSKSSLFMEASSPIWAARYPGGHRCTWAQAFIAKGALQSVCKHRSELVGGAVPTSLVSIHGFCACRAFCPDLRRFTIDRWGIWAPAASLDSNPSSKEFSEPDLLSISKIFLWLCRRCGTDSSVWQGDAWRCWQCGGSSFSQIPPSARHLRADQFLNDAQYATDSSNRGSRKTNEGFFNMESTSRAGLRGPRASRPSRSPIQTWTPWTLTIPTWPWSPWTLYRICTTIRPRTWSWISRSSRLSTFCES